MKLYLDRWLEDRIAFLDDYFERLTLGVQEANTENLQISVYPIPASDNIYVRHKFSDKALSYQLYSVYGKKVREGFLKNTTNTISISNLESGIYLFTTNTLTKKIIVAK